MIQESFERTAAISSEPSLGYFRCISWNAVILPALVGVGLSFLLYVFTAGLGLTVFTLSREGQISLAVGGFTWLVIASYMIMFLVGWIAGRSLVKSSSCSGVLHGFAAWCLALIVTAMLFSQHTTNAIGEPAYYTTNPSFSISQANANNANNVQTPNSLVETKQTVNNLGIGVLAIFFVFLAGALGSCSGGYVGGKARFREDEVKRVNI